MIKIIITGGHLTPAIAVIEELKKKNWLIYYFGRKYSLEGKKIPSEESINVPQLDVKFIPVISGRLQRKFSRHTFFSLLKVPLGFFQSLYLVGKIRPKIILSFGSYVSTPTVFAGWLLGVPIISHEQTVTVGLANKINSFFSKLIAVSFKESLVNLPRNKTVMTGNPLRKDVFLAKTNSFTREVSLKKRKWGFSLIYITGGNQGARIINLTLMELLPKLLKKYILVHQTGSLDFGMVTEFSLSLASELKERYFLKRYVLAEEIGWILKNADLIISRSGANITYELGALGKPAILIPLPIAGKGEQLKNAQRLVDYGLAEIIEQKNLTPESLEKVIEEMMSKINFFKNNGKNAEKNYPRNGAKKIVEFIYEILEKKEKS